MPVIAALMLLGSSIAFAVGPAGVSRAKTSVASASLGNEWISIQADNHLQHLEIEAPGISRNLDIGEAFSLQFKNGTTLHSSEMRVQSSFSTEALSPSPTAAQLASRFPGKSICTTLLMPGELGTVRWCAILRDGSKYIRQEISIQAGNREVPIVAVNLLDFSDPGAHVEGVVKGSPVVDRTLYCGFENPLSIAQVKQDRVQAMLPRTLPLAPGQLIRYSSVIGFAPEGQLRRDFLAYLERERAHPYRTFLHYNTWYDIGFRNRYDEKEAMDRIDTFGDQLVRKRHVVMNSFLFDDGWDDANTVWGFDAGFPDGFKHVGEEAAKYGFGIGVWLSPWGGYEQTQQSRVAAGRKLGYEVVKDGFALSGPSYYAHFQHTCMEMMRNYGVNQFKFDGTGNAGQVFPGSVFDSDFDAAIHLIGHLRGESPNLYINLTSGTYPSPFWLRYADSIWRGGMDHGFSGVGTWRQRWITYRDAQTYKHEVEAGPLFPLSSLMLHGLIYARQADHLDTDPGNDFPDEVRSYFGSGTQLQEMYITPSLLTSANWDVLAEAARWSRANASVLSDTHWIGGDPDRLQVYGWGAWAANRGILVLRNPSSKPQEITLDIGAAFELPLGAGRLYRMRSPWKEDRQAAPLLLEAGRPHLFVLKAFQVLTLEGESQPGSE